ncbi:MAG TPA: LanC-like protein [Gaiellales bacterium]|nr:LanC-like protein [Gaiellales bacterium]
MLFSPEYHEPLTGRAWDEAWVRGRIERIVAAAEGAVGDDGVWPEHPDDHDDDWGLPKTVYMGAAGVIWGMHAAGRSRPDLIRGLYQSYLAEPDWPGRSNSYWAGEAGILLVGQLLDADDVDLARLEEVVRGNADNESNELMWGAPGTMLVALEMYRRTRDTRWADAWRSSADVLWQRWAFDDEVGGHMWTQLLYGNVDRYIGPGHGFAGNVRSLFAGRSLLDDDRVGQLEERAVVTATALAFREGGLANWAPTVGPLAHRDRIRVQWCHGAPGVVSALAGVATQNVDFTDLLVAAGNLIWEAGPLATGHGLCHGTAGNAVAFLALHERTGDPLWAERARRFAVHALEQVERERQEHGMGRYSLWTGDIGAALVAQSCIDLRPGMPSLDWFEATTRA